MYFMQVSVFVRSYVLLVIVILENVFIDFGTSKCKQCCDIVHYGEAVYNSLTLNAIGNFHLTMTSMVKWQNPSNDLLS